MADSSQARYERRIHWLGRHFATIVAGAVLVGLVGSLICWRIERDAMAQALRERNAARLTHWENRCKTAGIFLYEPVSGEADGVELLRVRTSLPGGQFTKDDPYGRDYAGDDYIASFLRSYDSSGQLFGPNEPVQAGFKFVDVVEGGVRYRYTGSHTVDFGGPGLYKFLLQKRATSEPRATYGLTFEDLSSDEDLRLWVAGSSLKVVNLRSGKVVAERVGFAMDPEAGRGARDPWSLAPLYACPSVKLPNASSESALRNTYGQARRFADLILRKPG